MKISDVKVQSFRHPSPDEWGRSFGKTLDICVVTVSTDEGIQGHAMGRAQGGAPGSVLGQEILSVARPVVVGEDPMDRERIWQKLWNMGRRTRLTVFAQSCIDVALWDIAGKALNLPVYKLIGGYRNEVPAYASSAAHDSTEAFVEEALTCKARGFKGYKLHTHGVPEHDIEVCRALRKAVGDGYPLMIDVSGAYDRRGAMWAGRRLEELDFYWYEEPLPDFDIEGYAELCQALDIPVMAGEVTPGNVYMTAQFQARRATDILRADVYWKGGITGVMKIAHLAEAYGMKLEIHHAASSLMNWANLHCLGAFKNGDFLEVLIPADPLNFGLEQYIEIDAEGLAHLPQRPGLGVDIDWDYVNSHTTFKG